MEREGETTVEMPSVERVVELNDGRADSAMIRAVYEGTWTPIG